MSSSAPRKLIYIRHMLQHVSHSIRMHNTEVGCLIKLLHSSAPALQHSMEVCSDPEDHDY